MLNNNNKKISYSLNIFAQCRRYSLSIWQCPQFLFVVMGVLIIISSLVVYIIGRCYVESPAIIALMVLLLAGVLFIIAFIIIHSFEKLAEVSRLKTEFVNIVSHQLRAPITNLRWVIDLLELKKGEAIQKEYIDILKENSDRMEELIRDLLIISRIEQGEFSLKEQDVCLVELVKEMIVKFQPIAKGLHINITTDFQKDLPNIFVDRSQIKLVLENFLENAIHYSRNSGIIKIKLCKKKDNLYFEINDNGIGIPKEDHKFIFQKFFRARNVLKHQTQGSGLGLFIAKSIIQRSKGSIGFSSQKGEGSTFWFTIPIKQKA